MDHFHLNLSKDQDLSTLPCLHPVIWSNMLFSKFFGDVDILSFMKFLTVLIGRTQLPTIQHSVMSTQQPLSKTLHTWGCIKVCWFIPWSRMGHYKCITKCNSTIRSSTHNNSL